MPKSWNGSGASAIAEKPTKMKLNKGDDKQLGIKQRPFEAKIPRKPIGVYLSAREKEAVESKALKAGETMSEWIRNTIRKAANC